MKNNLYVKNLGKSNVDVLTKKKSLENDRINILAINNNNNNKHDNIIKPFEIDKNNNEIDQRFNLLRTERLKEDLLYNNITHQKVNFNSENNTYNPATFENMKTDHNKYLNDYNTNKIKNEQIIKNLIDSGIIN